MERVSPVRLTFLQTLTAWLCCCKGPKHQNHNSTCASLMALVPRSSGLPVALSAPRHRDFPRSISGSKLPVCSLRGHAFPALKEIRKVKCNLRTSNVIAKMNLLPIQPFYKQTLPWVLHTINDWCGSMGYGYRSSWPYVRISNMRLKWLEDAWCINHASRIFGRTVWYIPSWPGLWKDPVNKTLDITDVSWKKRGPKKWSILHPLQGIEKVKRRASGGHEMNGSMNLKTTHLWQLQNEAWNPMVKPNPPALRLQLKGDGQCFQQWPRAHWKQLRMLLRWVSGKIPKWCFFHLEYGEPLEFDSPYFQAEPRVISI